MDKKVEDIQQQLYRLGFPDMREEIEKHLASKEPVFKIESLRYFKYAPAGASDFLQYGVQVAPFAPADQQLTGASVTLMRVHSDKACHALSVKTKTARFNPCSKPLPTVESVYRQLKERMEHSIKKQQTAPKNSQRQGRQLKPNLPVRRGSRLR